MPRENPRGFFLATSANPTMARTSSTRRVETELAAASIRRWLRALRVGWKGAPSSTVPISRIGRRYLAEPTAVEPGLAAPVVEIEHQPHRRRLARAVRAEEPGDHARPDLERQVVDRRFVAVLLRQPVRNDHCVTFRSGSAPLGAAALITVPAVEDAGPGSAGHPREGSGSLCRGYMSSADPRQTPSPARPLDQYRSSRVARIHCKAWRLAP